MLVKTTDGTPDAVKVARPVWSGGKSGDNFKGLPITIILWLLESKTDTVSTIIRLLDCITENVKKEALKDGIGTNDDFSFESDPDQWV